MQLTTLLTTAFVAASTIVAAPVEERATKEVIGPFAIKIAAKGRTYNNKYLSGSHIGAAIDLAVPSNSPEYVYYVNATDGGYIQDGITYGRLEYNIAPNIPFQGGLAVNTSSNIANLLLSVETPEYTFSLNKANELQLGGLSRWYGCIGYSYGREVPSVNWKFGNSASTQKECQGLTLKAVFKK